MTDRYCPKCDVTMERTAVNAEGVGELYLETGGEKVVIERLGIDDSTGLGAFICPECGFVKFYANFST